MTAADEFARIAARHERCFWLDGGGSQPWSGRRSLLGWLEDDDVSLTYDAGRRQVVEHPAGRVVGDDVFAVLQDRLDGDPATHWVGFFGYAARPDLPARSLPGVPDAVWMRARSVRVEEGSVQSLARARDVDPEVVVPDWYRAGFDRVQEHLRAGNSYEVNLTYRVAAEIEADPVEVYRRLRSTNPAPYAGVLRHGDTWLLSASPERFATIDRNRRVETRPIKGTTPRGATPAEDDRLRALLAEDTKFRAENLMITDLLRNDLAMVCEPGSVAVPRLMEVESYPSVHQLVSTVTGHLRAEVGTVDALRAMFPAGSMTGAPKLRTMQVIDEVEAEPRGVYAGAFGWISGDGRADLGVVIRSLFRSGAGPWWLGTGGGITVRSDVAEEWAETLWKVARVRGALAG
ncbi:aminodeoxychorismate synthase component I [Marmoricola sp. RAF53]|uniref:aminodeoxychorismate synthase component I n=1 Tax=Marmoricola sp. RAF53 TaxID=3233059 RepID=UPI003F9CA99F